VSCRSWRAYSSCLLRLSCLSPGPPPGGDPPPPPPPPPPRAAAAPDRGRAGAWVGAWADPAPSASLRPPPCRLWLRGGLLLLCWGSSSPAVSKLNEGCCGGCRCAGRDGGGFENKSEAPLRAAGEGGLAPELPPRLLSKNSCLRCSRIASLVVFSATGGAGAPAPGGFPLGAPKPEAAPGAGAAAAAAGTGTWLCFCRASCAR
jgi:hypothetical protein